MSVVLPQFMSERREQVEVGQLFDCTPILGRRHSITVPAVPPQGSLLRNHHPPAPEPAPVFPFNPAFEDNASNGAYLFEREGFQPTKRCKSLCYEHEPTDFGSFPLYPAGFTPVPRRGSVPTFAHPVAPHYSVFPDQPHLMRCDSTTLLHPRTYRDAPLSSPLCQPNLSAQDYQQQMLQYERSHNPHTGNSTDTQFLSELESLELGVFAADSLHEAQKGLSPGYTPTDGIQRTFPHAPRGTPSNTQGSPTAPYFYDESRVSGEHYSPHVSPPYSIPPPLTPLLPPQEDFTSLAEYSPPTMKVDVPPLTTHFSLARARVDYPPRVAAAAVRPDKEKRKGLKWTNVTDSVTFKYSNPNQISRTRKGRTPNNQPDDHSKGTISRSREIVREIGALDSCSFPDESSV